MAARGQFSSKLGFVAAAAGSAVGLGNIWRFPYETGQNGGAAFLLVYLTCVFLIGFPVMVGEIAIGRKTQKNPYGAFRELGGKGWALVGLWGILCGVMILSFYNVVAGWAFGYFLQIGFGNLLNTENYGEFFGGYVSDVSDNLIYSLVFMIITAVIVFRGVQNGIERASKILMPLLFIILVSLIIYGLTLEGAGKGVSFYLFPELDKMTGKTIYSALGQAFFSLSLGMGALVTYGSYIDKKDNIVSSAGIVTIADSMVAFLAGLMIFPLVFSQGQAPTAGPGLVFVSLPGIFQAMGPVAGKIVGASFFLLLCFAALTSTISLLEVPVAYAVDEKKWSRKTSVAVISALIFIIGLFSMLSQGAVEGLTDFVHYEGKTKSFLDAVDDLFSTVGLPLGGFLITLFISLKWKSKNLTEEVMSGYSNYATSIFKPFINIMVTAVCPLVLGLIFVITVLEKYFGVPIIENLL